MESDGDGGYVGACYNYEVDGFHDGRNPTNPIT